MGLVNWNDALRNAGGSEVILKDLLQDCTSEAPRLMRQLNDALARGDADGARRAAHTLRSFSRLFGADAVGSLAGKIETLIRSGELPAAGDVLPELDRDVGTVVTEVKERLHGVGGTGE